MNCIKLQISGRRRLPYHLILQYKYTVIQGKSGTGKSELVRIVSRDETSINSNPQGLQVVAPRLLSQMSKQQILNLLNGYMMNPFDTVFIFDEDTPVISSGKFQEAIQEVDAFFILICRHPLSSLPYGIQQIYEMFSDGQCVTLVSKYKELFKCKPSALNGIQALYTEDSKSGYKFLANRTHCVKSAYGKDNVPSLLSQVSNTAFIVDSVGFGAVIQKALDGLGSNKLIFISSFEGALLQAIYKSNAFGLAENLAYPNLLYSSNVEVTLEETLKEVLTSRKLYRVDGSLKSISYSKEILLACLYESCGACDYCSKTARYNRCHLDLDWMYYMYPECVYRFVESHFQSKGSIRLRPGVESGFQPVPLENHFGN